MWLLYGWGTVKAQFCLFFAHRVHAHRYAYALFLIHVLPQLYSFVKELFCFQKKSSSIPFGSRPPSFLCIRSLRQWKNVGWLPYATSSIREVCPIRLNSLSVPGHGRTVGPSDSISCHLSVKWAGSGQRRHRGQCGDLS